ncbi:hypothetical protein [Streptomyces sp. NPDC007000]|uniref:hypothetical protein n=1 Tax=Streptomyces sp. NPDC007000 TaxID=3155357 RepID=UPI0033D9AD48
MDAEHESALLLLDVYRQARGSTMAFPEVSDFEEWKDIDDERLYTLVGLLEHAGLVSKTVTLGGSISCRLTPAGVAKAEQLQRDRDTPRVRYDIALNGLVEAAADMFPTHRLELQGFLGSPHARILDTVLTLDEIFSAVSYLEDEKLVTVERTGSQPTAITLTPQGKRCGWNDKIDVRGFLDGKQQPGIGQQINIHGGQNQFGNHNTQTNNINPSLAEVANFAQQVLEAAVTMDVPENVREQLTDDAEALQREATRQEPQPGRIRRAFEAVLETLSQTGQAASDAQALLETGQNLLGMFG